MSSHSKDIENRIQDALATYQHDKNLPVTKIAREFKVPYYRLYSRIHGKQPKAKVRPVNYILNEAQENAVKHWIHQLDEASHAPTAQQLQACANSILRRHHSDPNTHPPQVGKMWPYRFVERFPDYKRQKQKPMDTRRLDSEDIGVIQTWYDRLGIVMETHGIQACDLYNFDEIGFQEGQGRTESVITQYPERNRSLPSFSRGSLTMIEAISADGFTLPPLIILPGKGLLEDWFTHTDLPETWAITTTPTGYSSDDIAFDWIHHFNLYSSKRQMGKYRLLIMDNHGSHLTYNFIEYCEQHNILLYTLPPHTSHILQPLDGKPFQQYKYFHGKAVNEAARYGYEDFGKREFLQHLPNIRKNAFKNHTIISGFEDCGIYPFDADLVTNQLRERCDPIPDLQGLPEWGKTTPSPSSSQTSSPKSIQRLTRSIQKINAEMQKSGSQIDEISKDFSARIQKTLRGSQMQAELAAIRGDELNKHLQARMDQSKPRSRRQVPGLGHTGILSVKDANRRINHRKLEDMDKSRRRVQRETEREKAKKEAERAEYAKLEANIKNPAIPTDFNDLFRLQFGLDSI